jgi:hypothetical protein
VTATTASVRPGAPEVRLLAESGEPIVVTPLPDRSAHGGGHGQSGQSGRPQRSGSSGRSPRSRNPRRGGSVDRNAAHHTPNGHSARQG